jgi:hypothetical protein
VPDLLDELRRYGEAVEAAAIDRQSAGYPIGAEVPSRRFTTRSLLVGAAAMVVLVVVITVALTGDARDENLRVDTPPTVVETPPTPVVPTTMPSEPLPPLTDATQIPASEAVWKPLDPSPLGLRGASAAVWTGDQLILWGGYGDSLVDPPPELSDGASYDPGTDTWVPLPPAPIAGRARAVSAWSGSEMLIWGGGGGNSDWDPRMDGAAYDPVAGSWRTLPEAPLPAGPLYSGAWTGVELVVVGTTPDGLLSAAYDPAADSWRRAADVEVGISSPGSGLDVSWTGTRIVALESFPLGGPTRAIVYDPTADQWSVSTPEGYGSRSVDTAVLDGRLHVASYMQRPDGTTSFDPVTGTWTGPISINDNLNCEGGSKLLALTSRIFVTGCGESGLFDPIASSWQPIAPAPGFTGVVWTGTDLLAWGPGSEAEAGDGTTALWSLQP